MFQTQSPEPGTEFVGAARRAGTDMLLRSQNSVGWSPSLGGPNGQAHGSTSCGGGCVMRRSEGWARVRPQGAHIMRLGAWYQIVGNPAPNLVVLDIARRNVAIPRDLLQISPLRPDRFSVVPRSPRKLRGKADDSSSTYAVCPVSGTRVRLSGHPESVECPNCGHRGAVDWRSLPTRPTLIQGTSTGSGWLFFQL